MEIKFIYAISLSLLFAYSHGQVLKTKKVGQASQTAGTITSKSTSGVSNVISARSPVYDQLQEAQKELKELKEKKYWSAWAFHEFSPIYDDKNGFDMDRAGGFTMFALNYNAGWKYNPSVRALFLNSYSSKDPDGNDRELITMLDPHIQFSGTTWSNEKTRLTNWFRLSAPLSEGSANSGLVTQARIRTALSHQIGGEWSVSFVNWLIANFNGFSQGEDSSYGSASFELGVGGPINKNFALSVSYSTRAARRDGQGLGYLDFTGGAESISMILDLKFIKPVSTSIACNIPVDSESESKYSCALWLFKSLF